MKKKVRFAVIGAGNMGRAHCQALVNGRIPNGELVAVCDPVADLEARFPGLLHYREANEAFASGLIDAVIIATPHFSHVDLAIPALQSGLHVLVEKPVAVHKADCQRLLDAPRHPGQVVGAMFQMRTYPRYIKLKSIIESGELGKISRVRWTITDWYRTEHYYRSASWRATWGGEGGGALLNQCPHQLDLWQWLFGLPKKVYSICHFGKHHNIAVEDEVFAMFEYDNGMTGEFVTSTGEFPGLNLLEIVGERGRLIVEKEKSIRFLRLESPLPEHTAREKSTSGGLPFSDIEIPVEEEIAQQTLLIENFCQAILYGAPLIAPVEEGIHSLELANAMLLSGFKGLPVELPLDAELYHAELNRRIEAERECYGAAMALQEGA